MEKKNFYSQLAAMHQLAAFRDYTVQSAIEAVEKVRKEAWSIRFHADDRANWEKARKERAKMESRTQAIIESLKAIQNAASVAEKEVAEEIGGGFYP